MAASSFAPAFKEGTAPVIRILIADDHELVRSGLRTMLDTQDDLEVVGEAADGAAAIEEAFTLRPDVIVMDIRMPRLDGIEATRRILAQGTPAPKILVLTTLISTSTWRPFARARAVSC